MYFGCVTVINSQACVVVIAMWVESDDDDYDDSIGSTTYLERVSSVHCRCATCQQRHGANFDMLTVSNRSTVVLPADDDAGWSLFWQTVIDKDSLKYLREKRVINWCKGAYNLFPMKTTGKILFFINIHHIILHSFFRRLSICD